MVDTHSKMLSPLGPALTCAAEQVGPRRVKGGDQDIHQAPCSMNLTLCGGSNDSSASSFWMRFEAEAPRDIVQNFLLCASTVDFCTFGWQ